MEYLNRAELAKRMGMCRPHLDNVIKDELIPRPTHRVEGRRGLFYTDAEAMKIKRKYNARYDGYLTQRQMAQAIGISSAEQLWELIQHQHLSPPSHQIGKGLRRYYRCSDVKTIKEQYDAYRQPPPPIPTGRRRCRQCPNVAEEDRRHCASCLQKNKERQKKRREEGVCGACSAPCMPGKTKCLPCSKKAIKYAMAFQERHKAAGLCLSCSVPVTPPHAYCEKHRESYRTNFKRKYHAQRTKLL